jgi:hypothetical protein
MARQLTSIDPEPQYRAVIFYKHSGQHDLPMQTYTDKDGNTYEYHRVYAFGPYEKPGPAQAMVKRDLRYASPAYSYRNYYMRDTNSKVSATFPVAESLGIVEESLPVWGNPFTPNPSV